MGEIETVEGPDAGVVLRRRKPGSADQWKEEPATPGDRVLRGDEIRTGEGASVEILLGLNGRLRIAPSSRVRFVSMEIEEEGDQLRTLRKVKLHSGALRARVRHNSVTPAPVLVVSLDSLVSVGLPEYAVRGGVDALVRHPEKGETAEVVTLNGTIEVDAQKSKRLPVQRGELLELPVREGLGEPRPVAPAVLVEQDIVEWSRFLVRLRQKGTMTRSSPGRWGPLARQIWPELSASIRSDIEALLAGRQRSVSDTGLRDRMLDELNALLERPDLFTDTGRDEVRLSAEQRRRLGMLRSGELATREVVLQNRLLLESAFPSDVKDLNADAARTDRSIEHLKTVYAFSSERRAGAPSPPPRPAEGLGGP
jgi:hypothetical protein